LAQLAVGVAALGSVVVGGRIYARMYYQRASQKFLRSLFTISKQNLEGIEAKVLERGPLYPDVLKKHPQTNLDMQHAKAAVALIGDNRSGKTIFLCNTILYEMFPWWYRLFFPPRGLFLTGSKESPTVHDWLRSEIAVSDKDNAWAILKGLVQKRFEEQRIRIFLRSLLKDKLPAFLTPQPTIIVVDQAEELLRAYGADFLVGVYNLVKGARDHKTVQLILVINSENAVKSLKLMNGGDVFDIIYAPKVTRNAVVKEYGEEFAKIFDACDSCLGVALDYVRKKEKNPENMPSAKDYATMTKKIYMREHCLLNEITREAYDEAGDHKKKNNK
jgi:hypothetical protein